MKMISNFFIILSTIVIATMFVSTHSKGICIDLTPQSYLLVFSLMSILLASELLLIQFLYLYFIKKDINLKQSFLFNFSPIFFLIFFIVFDNLAKNLNPILLILLFSMYYSVTLVLDFYLPKK